jgi:hypothetical protein
MNARYFLPGTGRFISADTIIPYPNNPQSHNRYSYVRNNALNSIDPTGHIDCPDPDAGCAPANTPPPDISQKEYEDAILTQLKEENQANAYAGAFTARDRQQEQDRILVQQALDNSYNSQVMSGNQGCQYWMSCYEPVITAEEIPPDAAIGGLSGSGGALSGFVGGQEAIYNFDTDEFDIFGYAGPSTVFGEKTVGTGYVGLVWNLENNDAYKGQFNTVTVDLTALGGVQFNFFWEGGTTPFTGETWGFSAGGSGGQGGSISTSATYYWKESLW